MCPLYLHSAFEKCIEFFQIEFSNEVFCSQKPGYFFNVMLALRIKINFGF